MSKFVNIDLGPISEAEFCAVIKWLEDYEITDYVGSGYEDELDGIDPSRVWTEYSIGESGDYAQPGYFPPDADWVPQGYWVGKKSVLDFDKEHIWTYGYEQCTCDGEDDECSTCGGDGDVGYNFVELARSVLVSNDGAIREDQGSSFCMECGTKLPSSAKFCPSCGTKASLS